jgi:hypothetical protein
MQRFATTILLAVFTTTGCAYTIVKPVEPSDTARGYRYYDPLPLLLEGCAETKLFYLPNFNKGYAVQPRAWWAKNQYELQIEDGQLTAAKGTLDSTALLALLENVGSEAVESAGSLAALSANDGSSQAVRHRARIYRFDFDAATGILSGLTSIAELGQCPADAPGSVPVPATGGKAK